MSDPSTLIMNEPQHIPLRDAAKQLGVSPERVRQLIRAGRIPGAHVEPVFGRYMLPVNFAVTPAKRGKRSAIVATHQPPDA